MKRVLLILLCALAAPLTTSTAQASIIYDINPLSFVLDGFYSGVPFSGLSITGTVTTDGAIGQLQSSDILSSNLTFTLGTTGSPIGGGTVSSSGAFLTFGVLSASSSALTFDFGGQGQFSIGGTSGSITGNVYYNAGTPGNQQALSAAYDDPNVQGYQVFEGGPTTPTVIATAAPVPLPGAAWLLLSGLGGLGAFARRRLT